MAPFPQPLRRLRARPGSRGGGPALAERDRLV